MKQQNAIARSSLHLASAPEKKPGLLVKFLAGLQHGKLTVLQPNGERYEAIGKKGQEWVSSTGERTSLHADLRLHKNRVFRRVLMGGTVGLAEAYIDGDWDTPDLTSFLTLGCLNEAALGTKVGGLWPLKLWHSLRHMLNANTKRGSRRNIAFHYDLGNDFYRRWLDASMTYSAALFTSEEQDLEQAQQNKYQRLADMLDLQPGHSVLEIGCGWGGFAEFAARKYGCRVVGVTLSREQLDYARTRVAKTGLDDLVEIRLQDYRDVEGQFDRIASIEMFEAVGKENWPRYFDILNSRLKPGGIAALQVITIDDKRFETYQHTSDFIQQYIFPGGMLPSVRRLQEEIAKSALTLTAQKMFGAGYAHTLRHWHTAFRNNWPDIAPLGFDSRFYRMWTFYLSYCEAGFLTGATDVGHFRLEKK